MHSSFRFADQHALFALWLDKCGSRAMPRRDDFEATELRPWLGNVHLIEVIDGGRDYRYLVYGTEIGRHFDVEMTRRLASDWPEPMRSAAFNTYGRVVSQRAPYIVSHNEHANGRLLCIYRLVLPLSRDGHDVDHLLTHLHAMRGAEHEHGVRFHRLDSVA